MLDITSYERGRADAAIDILCAIHSDEASTACLDVLTDVLGTIPPDTDVADGGAGLAPAPYSREAYDAERQARSVPPTAVPKPAPPADHPANPDPEPATTMTGINGMTNEELAEQLTLGEVNNVNDALDMLLELGISQSEIARRCGITQGTLSNYRAGRQRNMPITVQNWLQSLIDKTYEED